MEAILVDCISRKKSRENFETNVTGSLDTNFIILYVSRDSKIFAVSVCNFEFRNFPVQFRELMHRSGMFLRVCLNHVSLLKCVVGN